MTIPIITRTNTIDEWRIQTNLSAEKLNDLETGNFNKSNGILTISNTASIVITAEGTPLQVANNVLFQKELTVGTELIVGASGSGIGNVITGGTVTITGPNNGLSVSNNAIISKDLNVVRNVYSGNASVNNSATVGGDVIVGGIVKLTSNGTVLYANTGSVVINNATLSTATLDRANANTIYALEAFIDNLSDIASAVIGILRVTTGNIYYLTSNTSYANTGTIKDFVANNSANLVNLTSNVSIINTAFIGNLNATSGNIINGNIVSLTSDTATLNTSTLVNTTVTNAAISNAIVTSATITTANISNLNATNGTIINGNVVTLTSNQATLNTSTLLSSNIVSANIVNANVSGNVNFVNGSTLKLNSGSGNSAIVVDSGLTTLKSAVIEGNLTVSGIFTQTGNINFETDRFIFNANTPDNKDAYIINKRVAGNNAQILWNESNDRWEVSTGNTWTTTYKILDGADIYTGVDSSSTTLVASASAVKFAYEAGGVIAGGYANAAYRHANSAFLSQNTSGVYANAAYTHANAAFIAANTPSHVANSASVYANAAYRHANAAYDTANTALIAGGQIAGSYANSAYLHANSAHDRANAAWAGTTGTHANSAYFTANTALTNAAIADQKAVTANANANIAFVHANSAFNFANTVNNYSHNSYTHANASFAAANNKYDKTGGTISGDVVITGSLSVAGVGATINANEMKIADGIITLNSDILQGASPIENAGIEVDRGASPNVYVRWNELSDKWELTNDGSTYYNIITSNDLSGGSGYLPISGGTMTGNITMSTDKTIFLSGDPTSLYQPATKNYVDTRLASFSTLPSQTNNGPAGKKYLTTDGTNASWYEFTGTYAISISGTAARATYAVGPVTDGTAQNWPRATNADTATSLNGGTITNCGGFSQTSGSFTVGSSVSTNFNSSVGFGSSISGTSASFSGTVTASFFNGTASQARYADLAEKFLADQEYPIGTLVSIGGEKEVTAATIADFKVFGVVSSNPAYTMNSELEGGTAIALKGRVPVRVIGKIKKGQPLGASNFSGIASVNYEKYFGLAIETKDTDEEGLVETAIL